MLEEIMNRRNVEKSFLQVERNKGVGGIDGMQTDKLRDNLNANYQAYVKAYYQATTSQALCRK